MLSDFFFKAITRSIWFIKQILIIQVDRYINIV